MLWARKSSRIMSLTLFRFHPNPKWMENGIKTCQYTISWKLVQRFIGWYMQRDRHGEAGCHVGSNRLIEVGCQVQQDTRRSGLSRAKRQRGEVGCHVRRDRHSEGVCHVQTDRQTQRSGLSSADRHTEKRVVTCGEKGSAKPTTVLSTFHCHDVKNLEHRNC